MTDRELLELAAKAAGIYYWIDADAVVTHSDTPGSTREWNPLTNSGDAFELYVKLRLDIGFEKLYMVSVWCPPLDEWVTEYSDDGMGTDIAEKTRRAIVRAAARIGKEMK
jgi:hypothetical protein